MEPDEFEEEREYRKPPTKLSKKARALWDNVQRDFELEEHHFIMLEQACRACDLAEKAQKEVAKSPTVVGTRGDLRPNPMTLVASQQTKLFAQLCRELRLDHESNPKEGPRRPRLPE